MLEGLKTFERQYKIGQGVELHLQRALAQLIVTGGIGGQKIIYRAMLLLNELGPTGLVLFSESAFASAQRVTLNIPNLKNFLVKGKVMSCKEVALSSGIIPKSAYRYRLRIQFEFADPAEQKAVEEYCEFLRTEYLQTRAG